MKKVVFIIKSMAVSGGAEKVLSIVVNNINGYEVILITFDANKDYFFYAINNNVKIVLFNNKIKFLAKILNYLKCIKYLIYLKPHTVIVFNASCYIPLAFFSKLYTSKYIASEHSTFNFFEKSTLRKCLLYLSHFFVTKYTILSDSVNLTFPRFIQLKSSIIENPILYKKKYKNIKQSCNFKILNVGRLSEEKNQMTLIDAVALIAPNFPNNLFVKIYGDGHLKETLIRRINSYGLDSVITIHKPVPDLSQVYSEADLFVMPSHYEGYGLAAAEALACGIPVVGFESCLGLKSFVKDGYNGLLVRANSRNYNELAKAINNVLSNRSYLEQLSSRACLNSNLSLNNIINKWNKLIEN